MRAILSASPIFTLLSGGYNVAPAHRASFSRGIGLTRSTFMGIAIHNLSSSGEADAAASATDLAAAVRQAASGILGTTVQFADLVRLSYSYSYYLG